MVQQLVNIAQQYSSYTAEIEGEVVFLCERVFMFEVAFKFYELG